MSVSLAAGSEVSDRRVQADSPRVSVIIVNWNGRHHLATCLGSLRRQTFADFELILVDNGSGDGSLELVRGEYPWVRLVELAANSGFAAGNNRGIELARGEYIVTLNNDTRVAPDWLERLVEVADRYPQAGMVGCRICAFTDPDLLDSIGIGICRDGMSRGRFRNRRWSALKLEAVEEILLPSACAALYKREMLAQIGLFDEDFFAYAEDTDLGLRGRLAGWSALAATGAVVYHKYSQTGGALSPFKVYLVERNHYWVAIKNFPFSHLLGLPFFTLIRYLVQAGAVVADRGTGREFRADGGAPALLGAVARGLFDGLRALPRIWRQRRRRSQQRETPGTDHRGQPEVSGHGVPRDHLQISGREFAALLRRYRITFRELLDHG